MLAKRYVITANTSPMTGTYAGTRIVPSAAVSPTSPSASADSSSARPAGSHLGPLAGAEVQGNTSTAPEPQPLGRYHVCHRQLAG